MGDTSRPRRLLGAARSTVRRTNNTQRVGAVGAIALLATAPFGGLEAAGDPPLERLSIGRTMDVGPYDVTVEKVFTIDSLAPDVVPREGNRLLVIRVEVVNDSDRPQRLALLNDESIGAFYARDTGVVPFEDPTLPMPLLFHVEDERTFENGDTINPGVTYRIGLILEQSGDWQGEQIVLGVNHYQWREEATLALSAADWELAGPMWEGPVPVEPPGATSQRPEDTQ